MRFTYVLLALAVAAPALAQQGAPLTAKDVERLDPARVILDRREALKLQPAQIVVLDSIRKAFDDSAKKVADDVRKHQRAITSPPPLLRRPPEGKPETRKDSLSRAQLDSTNRVKRDRHFETVTTGRRDLAAALLALKELFDATLASTIQALDGSQHTAAALSMERASEEFTRRLRLANVR
jgi:hypothetical protein